MLEGKFDAVIPQLFTANGTSTGHIQVADTAGFRVKQVAYLINNTFANPNGSGQPVPVQIKRVLSPTTLIVGYVDGKIASWPVLDVSGFLVANAAAIGAQLQNNNNIPGDDHYRAIYESDPVVADRVILVDDHGQRYNEKNPVPVAFDGTISIGDVTVVGTAPNHYPLEPNPNGSINVVVTNPPTTGNAIINQYSEANSVPAGATTTVTQYVTPISITSALLQRISVSGENIAKWTVFINSDQIDTRRTFYGSSLSEYFEFATSSNDGIALNPGDTVIVKVLHNNTHSVGDFESRIQVLQIT